MVWSKKENKCKNCLTTLFKHKAQGFCYKCYPIIQKMNAIDCAHENELYCLKIYYQIEFSLNNDLADKIKLRNEIKESIKQIYLHYIELYGKIENNLLKVDILRLEYIFNEISKKVNGNRYFYTNDLSTFQCSFSEEELKIIALKLLKMLIKKKQN